MSKAHPTTASCIPSPHANPQHLPHALTLSLRHRQSWDAYFSAAAGGAGPGQAYQAPPSLQPPSSDSVPVSALVPQMRPAGALGMVADEKNISDHLSVVGVIRSYQVGVLVSAAIESRCCL